MSISSKMTAIADQIRTLQGGEDKLGLDAMATQLGAANETVTSQTDLIAQIQTALDGKAGGGSSSGAYCWRRLDYNATDPELPSGYTRLEYIESNADSYINTGLTPTANTKIVGKVYPQSAGFLYGSETGEGNNSFGFYTHSTASFSKLWYASGSLGLTLTFDVFEFVHEANKLYIDGALKATVTSTGTVNSGQPLYLFVTNRNGAVAYYMKARIYSFDIYQDGATLSRHFIPCKDASGKACLYDTVTAKAYYATATLNAGAEADYAAVDYVVGDDLAEYPNGDYDDDGLYYELISDTLATMATALNTLGVETT